MDTLVVLRYKRSKYMEILDSLEGGEWMRGGILLIAMPSISREGPFETERCL